MVWEVGGQSYKSLTVMFMKNVKKGVIQEHLLFIPMESFDYEIKCLNSPQ